MYLRLRASSGSCFQAGAFCTSQRTVAWTKLNYEFLAEATTFDDNVDRSIEAIGCRLDGLRQRSALLHSPRADRVSEIRGVPSDDRNEGRDD